ncbi:hypothetical protein OIO90_004147 [Microbotryomycetes sp. JL221]|nr:hypothetical protein OIO90_004147 [Microbotryomycetes sp. JL221]
MSLQPSSASSSQLTSARAGAPCETCRRRKVRCTGDRPACVACKKHAITTGKDPEMFVCKYPRGSRRQHASSSSSVLSPSSRQSQLSTQSSTSIPRILRSKSTPSYSHGTIFCDTDPHNNIPENHYSDEVAPFPPPDGTATRAVGSRSDESETADAHAQASLNHKDTSARSQTGTGRTMSIQQRSSLPSFATPPLGEFDAPRGRHAKKAKSMPKIRFTSRRRSVPSIAESNGMDAGDSLSPRTKDVSIQTSPGRPGGVQRQQPGGYARIPLHPSPSRPYHNWNTPAPSEGSLNHSVGQSLCASAPALASPFAHLASSPSVNFSMRQQVPREFMPLTLQMPSQAFVTSSTSSSTLTTFVFDSDLNVTTNSCTSNGPWTARTSSPERSRLMLSPTLLPVDANDDVNSNMSASPLDDFTFVANGMNLEG